MNFVKTRAAVAWAPKQPLVIEELDLMPPQAGEVLVRLVAPAASAIPMPTRWTGWTRKAFSPVSSAMKARAWWSRSAQA